MSGQCEELKVESGDERPRGETNDIINVGWRPAHQANEGQARSGFVISRVPSNMSELTK